MGHEKYTEMIESYAAGELSKDAETELIAHIGACETCRRSFDDAKKFESLMQRMLAAGAPAAAPKVSVSAVPAMSAEIGAFSGIRESRHRVARLGNYSIIVTTAAVVLMSVGLIFYLDILTARNDALIDKAHSDIHAMMRILKDAKSDISRLPGEDKRITELLDLRPPRTDAPYVHPDKTDPWGRPYKVVTDAWNVRIYSFGPNGIDEGGLGDDISVFQ
jgi:hypothetical protein